MDKEFFVLDAVAHAYNFGEESYAQEAHAAAITNLAYGLIAADPALRIGHLRILSGRRGLRAGRPQAPRLVRVEAAT